MSAIIKVDNISKQYRLGQVGTGSFNHDLNRWWHRVRGKEDPYLKIGEANDRTAKGSSDYVWALQDISFEVQPGEVLGIVGRNGAGKSTLLKILSRTTTPTTGRIQMKGRVASLLEVGTGFHADLSGRENIYLNGAILGMRRQEINSKLDEIIDFAGVERYIDTPVKRYSSGMYVRLAFAVAAHLEPEILIVDEVLAVGDAEFQKKCLGKMKDVSERDGRTVLFVSHQLGSIQQLCNRALLMEKGLIAADGNPFSVINQYMLSSLHSNHTNYKNLDPNRADCYFKQIYLTKPGSNLHLTEFGTSDEIQFHLAILTKKFKPGLEFSVSVLTSNQAKVFTINELISPEYETKNEKEIVLTLRSNFLTPGSYTISAAIHLPRIEFIDKIEHAFNFSIVDTGSNLAAYEGDAYGFVFADYIRND